MAKMYSRTGDEGMTDLWGGGRVPKTDRRMEALGTIDELNASIGLVRSQYAGRSVEETLLRIQRHLYGIMAEIATAPEKTRTQVLAPAVVDWLETETDALSSQTDERPSGFIVPGDTFVGALVDQARTVTRRAERRVVDLFANHDIDNPQLLRFLNRLSSFLFALELWEIRFSAKKETTPAKPA